MLFLKYAYIFLCLTKGHLEVSVCRWWLFCPLVGGVREGSVTFTLATHVLRWHLSFKDTITSTTLSLQTLALQTVFCPASVRDRKINKIDIRWPNSYIIQRILQIYILINSEKFKIIYRSIYIFNKPLLLKLI